MKVEGRQSLLPTLYKQWLEAEISNRQDGPGGDESELLLFLTSFSAAKNKENSKRLMRSAQC
jgi:hypothetical protein